MKSKPLSLSLSLSLSLFVSVSLSASAASLSLKEGRSEKTLISSRTDKTAVWTGDLLTYTVQVVHDPDVEFVRDYLNPEKLSLSPFIIRSLTLEERAWGDKKKSLEIKFLLSTYEIGKNELVIPPINLFYFRQEPGFRRSEARESVAQTVRVPAFTVGLRSTLTGSQLRLRDYKPVPSRDRRIAPSALAVGLLGMACIAGVGVKKGARLFRSGRRAGPRKTSRRGRAKLLQKRLSDIQALGRGSPQELQLFYEESDRFLRDLLRERLNIETAGMTAEEIDKALKESLPHASLEPEIKAVLDDCDRVRYGKDGLRAAGERTAQVSGALERIVRAARE